MMGQQQLLLIVIGVITVGIAIIVGISVAITSLQSGNRDHVIADLNTLSNYAHQYYRKTTIMGGGNNSFTGWTIPSALDTTENGTYTATVGSQTITIVGTGFEKGNDGTTNVKATAVVTITGISITIDN